MTDGSPSSLGDEIADASVRGMVAELEPAWRVESIERSEHGTDFDALLGVRTPDGPRTTVLKATTADLVDPVIARSEPRLLELMGRETNIPVPTVFGYRDEHDEHPAPFSLMSYVEGENFEGRPDDLAPEAREVVVREAGANLADLHELGTLPAVGRVGVKDGELTVLDTDDHPRYDDFRDSLLDGCEETIESFESGGFFPDLADDPERFADLVPGIREYVREAIPALPELDPPRYCHWEYRCGNLLVDPETGATNAVLDWANLTSADPANNLAKVESHLLSPGEDGPERTAELRATFRTVYAANREEWAFDDSARERMRVYRFAERLGAMACLPLWHGDATPEERDERAKEHREFVAEYL